MSSAPETVKIDVSTWTAEEFSRLMRWARRNKFEEYEKIVRLLQSDPVLEFLASIS